MTTLSQLHSGLTYQGSRDSHSHLEARNMVIHKTDKNSYSHELYFLVVVVGGGAINKINTFTC